MTINESLYRNIELSERHLVVLVHGYGANSKSMGYIERIMKYLYPHIEVLNSKIN
jgi:predicted esterase